jgi:hypothetical protein
MSSLDEVWMKSPAQTGGREGIRVRQLQVVGVSDDGRVLLLAPGADRRATHCVELDRRLERAVRGQPIDESDVLPAAVTPKEIQARLRAGQSVEQVAREAGVPIGKVERYAGPVLSERERALDAARDSTMVRPRGAASRLPLGAAVEVNLSELAHAHPESAEWGAYRKTDGSWVVTFDVTVRGRRRRAEWAHRPAAREVTALNTYAASLGMAETARGRRPPRARPLPRPPGRPCRRRPRGPVRPRRRRKSPRSA